MLSKSKEGHTILEEFDLSQPDKQHFYGSAKLYSQQDSVVLGSAAYQPPESMTLTTYLSIVLSTPVYEVPLKPMRQKFYQHSWVSDPRKDNYKHRLVQAPILDGVTLRQVSIGVLSTQPDKYYMTWPRQFRDDMLAFTQTKGFKYMVDLAEFKQLAKEEAEYGDLREEILDLKEELFNVKRNLRIAKRYLIKNSIKCTELHIYEGL